MYHIILECVKVTSQSIKQHAVDIRIIIALAKFASFFYYVCSRLPGRFDSVSMQGLDSLKMKGLFCYTQDTSICTVLTL